MVDVGNAQDLLGKTHDRTAADARTAHIFRNRSAVFVFCRNDCRTGAHADDDGVFVAGNVKAAASDALKLG